MDIDFTRWGRCQMEWLVGLSSESFAPPSIWRIDVLVTSSPKVPLVRWPCSTVGDRPPIASDAVTRQAEVRWARLMSASLPRGAHVANALELGAGQGGSTLRTALFATGVTVALEPLPKNFEVLEFFAEINPALHIEAFQVAAADVSNHSWAHFTENWAHGMMVSVDDEEESATAPARAPADFLIEMHGMNFLSDVGFVNVATEGSETLVLQSLKLS